MKRFINLMMAAAIVMWHGASFASEEVVLASEAKSKLEAVLTKSGGTLDYFNGPSGMIGVGVTMKNGKQMVVYATPDGSTLFSGVAVDVASGKNISNADMQNLPPPNFEGLFDKIHTAAQVKREITTITEGSVDSENIYYVFVDPRCPYCHKTYDAFLGELAYGKDLVVHYIPVGILSPESENAAKELVGVAEKEGIDLMRKHARREAHVSVSEDIQAGNGKHGMNLALFRGLQLSAVPVVVSSVGGEFEIRQGMIKPEVIRQELQVAALAKNSGAGQ